MYACSLYVGTQVQRYGCTHGYPMRGISFGGSLVHLLRPAFAEPRVHPSVQFSQPACARDPLLLPSKRWNYREPTAAM